MKAGFFELDITPVAGAVRSGYTKRYLTGVHDPLKVRAAVFEDAGKRVALIGLDAANIGFDSVDKAKNEISKSCGIPPENVCIAASHTHSGAAVDALSQISDLAKLPPGIRELAIDNITVPEPEYKVLVIKRIAGAVAEADKLKEEALISVGSGCEGTLIFNRRFKMKNGRVYTHPGKLNPDIIEAAGPVDPEVGVIGAWRENGSLIGCIVNYACHATCDSSSRASADWVYYLQKTVRKMFGEEAGVVLLNGACGDVTQVNNLAYSVDGGQQVAEKLGCRVGAEVLKVLLSSEHEKFNELDARCLNLRLKRRRPSPESVERSREIVKNAAGESAEFIFAKERILADYIASVQPEIDVPVGAIKIGNSIFLSNPAEYFCQFGLNIKAASPFDYTFVVSLANGTIGYVPTPESFEAAGGGYETVLTSYSNMEVKAGEKIREASISLAEQLTPEKVPEKPRSKSWKEPWGYGVLGPDID